MTILFYLIMKDGDRRQWWNAEAESWGTRQAATRYYSRHYRPLPNSGRWVGPCDGTEG